MMGKYADRSEFEMSLGPEATSVGMARDAAAGIAREVGASEEDVKLAVSEAVANAVVHAFRGKVPGAIGVRINTEPGLLVIQVSDDGIGMSPNVESPGLGLGIALITKVCHHVNFDSTEKGTTVAMSFAI